MCINMIGMIDRKDIISEYERCKSIRAVAKRLGYNRKTVRNYVREYLQAQADGDESLTVYLKSEPTYTVPPREKTVLTEEVCNQIDAYLKNNIAKRSRGDHKLCMRASDIHQCLLNNWYRVSYPSVCRYIRSVQGHTDEQECFIRQLYTPGYDCEFDWGEMYLTIDGVRRKVYMAVFTLAYSNHRTAYLFLHQDTQAFLESHKHYFKSIGSAPHRMVYDNMRVAIKSFVGGKHPTDALIRMEAAYGFTHRFCNIRRGNEKGHVERSVEVVRRKAFCQMDVFESLEDAQAQIALACSELNTLFVNNEGSAEEKLFKEEVKDMLPLTREIECFEQQTYTVDKYGTVIIGGIHYSVPDNLVGKKVIVHSYSNKIKAYIDHTLVAEHERTPINGWKLDIIHYLTTLKKKPGAVAGSVAFHMMSDELKRLFESSFINTPADFILLLQEAKECGLTFDDIVEGEKQIRAAGMHVSLDAFKQIMFAQCKDTKVSEAHIACASSEEIERFAVNNLNKLKELMEPNNTKKQHLNYGREA